MHVRLLCATTLGLLPLATTTSCTKLSIVGVSDQFGGRQEAVSAPYHSTEVIATRSELLRRPDLPALGDIDGDGFDDFILMASPHAELAGLPDTAYLFYGRAEFPDELHVQEADATFKSAVVFANSLGDINGDGYADFALASPAAIELVFGGPQRLSGQHAMPTTGAFVWSYEQKALPSTNLTTQIDGAIKLGDTNGDGYDDFALQLTEEAPDDKNVFGAVDVIIRDFVILGREADWPSGVWDPNWASASFGKDSGESVDRYSQLCISRSGDFDGDGLTDILAQGWDRHWLFYGRPQGFQGVLAPDNADAELHFGQDGSPFAIGDLDADGADDIAVPWTNDLKIIYGPRQRWSGRVQLQADLTFYDQGSYYNPIVGDLNGDGHPELLFFGNAETMHWDGFTDDGEHRVVYQVKGTGQRLTGRVQLTSADVYTPIGYAAPPVLASGGFTMENAGDLDGDGSSDLIVGAAEPQEPADGYILLLPGAARTPD